MEERIYARVEEIDEVLGWLSAMKFLSKQSAKGSHAIFRLNLERIEDAKEFVAEAQVSRARHKH